MDFFGSQAGVFGELTKLSDVTIENGGAQIGKHAFSWLKRGMMTGTIMTREVTVHAPSGGKVEEFCVDNGFKFVSTGGTKAPQFSDVASDAYYSGPVRWAVFHGITQGTGASTFSPNDPCQQVQIITFLWRAAGQPASGGALPADAGPAYAEGALRWAMEKGMIDSTFQPGAPCTRASAVKFMWQAVGSPRWSLASHFTDVPADADYATAVGWAVGTDTTNGTGDTTFSPGGICTRGQIVTFLYRARTQLLPQ